MEMDAAQCYRAVKARDARFDGRFFTGVRTTRIYCRPVCPARIPKRSNVEFYPCAAAAEEAGFRPCLRCRPEASPGTPAWRGTSATVSRGLRLISEGILDEHGVPELARRLGVGSRHLRRLFTEHLGATPVAIAQSMRVQLAKKLIDETVLPLSEIAYCAGFSSVRRFNAAFSECYRRPPSEIRRANAERVAKKSANGLRLTLSYRPPYDWNGLVGFFKVRATPGVEHVEDEVYRRTISLGEDRGILEIRHDADRRSVVLRVSPELSHHLPVIVERVRRLFDLRADPEEIAMCFRDDSLLGASIAARPGLRVPGAWDGFEIAVRAILGQQVSVKGATTLCGRFAERYGEPIASEGDERLTHFFPTPERIASSSLDALGVPGARALAIRELARAVVERDLSFSTPGDLDEVLEALLKVRGVGPWTAHYIAMRAFGEPDAFPSGDLGLRKAATATLGEEVSEKKLIALAEAWRPWRAYAAMHLWSMLPGIGAVEKQVKRKAS